MASLSWNQRKLEDWTEEGRDQITQGVISHDKALDFVQKMSVLCGFEAALLPFVLFLSFSFPFFYFFKETP